MNRCALRALTTAAAQQRALSESRYKHEHALFGAGEPKPRSYADRARDGLAALGQKASDAQFEAEGLLGLRPKTAEEQLYEACCPSLSYQTRLIGFCACMFASFILALFASFMLRRLLWRGDAAPFAIAYTLDNVVAIVGSMFMAGPMAQLRTMCAPKRRVSTTIYVLALALTLFFAFATQVPDGARASAASSRRCLSSGSRSCGIRSRTCRSRTTTSVRACRCAARTAAAYRRRRRRGLPHT